MFEHVGVGSLSRVFFDTVARCLQPDGVALLHAIGRSDGPGFTNPWIAKYIFPGGYCPALSEVVPRIEQRGLFVTDIEILRLHYAETLRNWRRNFTPSAMPSLRYTMSASAACSSLPLRRRDRLPPEGHIVFQIQFAHQQTAVPLRGTTSPTLSVNSTRLRTRTTVLRPNPPVDPSAGTLCPE